MKRCHGCNALIREDDLICPYCNEDSGFIDSLTTDGVSITAKRLESAAKAIAEAGSTAIELGRQMEKNFNDSVMKFNRILTPNEIGELKGLKGEKNGRNG